MESRFLPSSGKGQDAFNPVEWLECQEQPCGSASIPILGVAVQLAWSGSGSVGKGGNDGSVPWLGTEELLQSRELNACLG